MIRYLETFYRHRLLFVAPVVIAIAVSLAFAWVQPRQYESSGNIWLEIQVASVPDPNGPAFQTVTNGSDQYVAELHELLTTRDFTLKVAARGPLAAYMATNPPQVTSFTSLMTRAFHAAGIGSQSTESIDDLIYNELNSGVAVVAAGPQVVKITVTSTSPTVAAGTAQAIIDEFSDVVLTSRRSEAQAAVDFYQVRLDHAQQELSTAQSQLAAYLSDHKAKADPAASTDTQAVLLTQSVDSARVRYEQLLASSDQASLDLAHVADKSGFRVLDRPAAPSSALSFTKKLFTAGLAGLLLGALLSTLTLVVMTLADRTARRPGDVERFLDLDVVASIPRIRRHEGRELDRLAAVRVAAAD